MNTQIKGMPANEKKKLFDLRRNHNLNKSHNIFYPNDLKARDKPDEILNKSYDPNLNDLSNIENKQKDHIFRTRKTMPIDHHLNQ